MNRRERRKTARAHRGEGGRSPLTAFDQQSRALIEKQVLATSPHLADSACMGVAVITFWRGGPLKEEIASHILISPELNPRAVAPYLRSQADALEGRVPGVDFGG